jgi:hypothetical protein
MEQGLSPRPVLIPRGAGAESSPETLAGTAPPTWPPFWPAADDGSASTPEPGTGPPRQPAEKVPVPDVVGTDSGVATLRLMALGFEVKVRRDRPAGSTPAAGRGNVVEQSPRAGTAAPKGSEITLTIR